MKPLAFFALAILSIPGVVPAQHQKFVANPDTSQVKMTLKTTHELVNGTFHLQSARIEFDRNTSTLTGTVVVAAGSGKTGNGMRDRRMDKEILKVNQYASITFAPRTYSGTIAPFGDSSIQVSGTFTLLGSTHDLTIPVEIHIDGSKTTAKSQFVIPYVQWGVKNPSFLFWKADDDVAIDFNMAGEISN